eukprot:15366340-Ditylum_brightwellii.AAC.2
MSLHRGYEKPGKVLKLTKTLYGLAQAPLAWFTMLKHRSEETGHWASHTRYDCKGFELCVEDNAAGFLEIKLERQDDGSIELKQTALIRHIIETVGFQNATAKHTPAEINELPADKDGPGPQESWSYSSVIDTLMNQKINHEKPAKRTIHYLIGARDTRPGRFGFELQNLLDCGAKKMIRIHPVLRACLAMEAEYIALSHSMRENLPTKWLSDKLSDALKLECTEETTISMVWEDNVGVLTLDNNPLPRMTPCSKHITVKYHWFREWINNKDSPFIIASDLQKADILTKPLGNIHFREKQQMLMG